MRHCNTKTALTLAATICTGGIFLAGCTEDGNWRGSRMMDHVDYSMAHTDGSANSDTTGCTGSSASPYGSARHDSKTYDDNRYDNRYDNRNDTRYNDSTYNRDRTIRHDDSSTYRDEDGNIHHRTTGN